MRKRRPFFLVGCLVFLFVSALPALGQDEVEVLTNADVVRLTESGLPASVIVAKIETSWTDFDTSVDALVALSEAKVDPAVLEAMTNAGAEPAPAASDSAALDVARAVCRRAERRVVQLAESGEEVGADLLAYLNRLSDLLWILGRQIEVEAGADSALRNGKAGGPKWSRAW